MAGPSSVTKCSVGIHLNSPCYLKRFVKENFELDTLDDLDDNTRKTVELRVNISHVSSNCKHHKVAFSTRFSLYHQSVKCSNIFGKHKSSVPTGNNIVTLANCEKTLLPKNLIFTFFQGNVFVLHVILNCTVKFLTIPQKKFIEFSYG